MSELEEGGLVWVSQGLDGTKGEKGKSMPIDVGTGRGARVGWGWKNGNCVGPLDLENGYSAKCDEGIFWGLRNTDIRGNLSGAYLGIIFFDEVDLDEKSFDFFGKDYGHAWQWSKGEREWEKVREYDNGKNVFGIYVNYKEKNPTKKKYKFVIGESPYGSIINNRVIYTGVQWGEVVKNVTDVGTRFGGWSNIKEILDGIGKGWIDKTKLSEACTVERGKWKKEKKKNENCFSDLNLKLEGKEAAKLIKADDWTARTSRRGNRNDGVMKWKNEPLIKGPRGGKTNDFGACLLRAGEGEKMELRKLWWDDRSGWLCGRWDKSGGKKLDDIYKFSQGGNERNKERLCDFIFGVEDGAEHIDFFKNGDKFIGGANRGKPENKEVCISSWSKWAWLKDVKE